MYTNVIMAGFGGQGVMLIGNLLAQAGIEQGLNVTFFPVYGAEMRGGTANCTVVVSSDPVGSPIVKRPLSTIVLNLPSLLKFQPRLSDGGVQVVNASLIGKKDVDPSKRTVYIPVNDIANDLGSPKMANIVALGAFLKATGAVSPESAVNAMGHVFSERHAHLIPTNAKALEAGYAFA